MHLLKHKMFNAKNVNLMSTSPKSIKMYCVLNFMQSKLYFKLQFREVIIL